MNREIKFRGYSEELKHFVYGFFQEVEAEGIGYSYIFWQGNTTPVRADSVAQFTGIHDKNGKEIYEGDIVTDGVGKFKIVYDLKLAGYQPYCIFRDDPENYCEVIGNIYENPELTQSSE